VARGLDQNEDSGQGANSGEYPKGTPQFFHGNHATPGRGDSRRGSFVRVATPGGQLT
jgi:hypothetical protein